MTPEALDLFHPFVEIASVGSQQRSQNATGTGSGNDTEGQRGAARGSAGDSLEHAHLVSGARPTARQDDGSTLGICWPLGH